MPRNTLVGTARFLINGVQYQLAGDLKFNPLTQRLSPLVGMDGHVAGQAENLSPMVECLVRDRADIDLVPLNDLIDATVTLELLNGSAWELSNAFFAGDGDFDVKEGTYSVRFHGSKMQRIV